MLVTAKKMIITQADFEALSNTKMQWAGYGWRVLADRFNTILDFDSYAWAYWFDDAASMILAKNFLFQNGLDWQHSYDEGTNNYIIVTNYNSDIKVSA